MLVHFVHFLLCFLSLTIQAGQCSGVLYGGDGSQLMANIVGLAVIVGWSGGASAAVFSLLRNMGWLRLSEEREDEGMDDNEVGVWPRCTLKIVVSLFIARNAVVFTSNSVQCSTENRLSFLTFSLCLPPRIIWFAGDCAFLSSVLSGRTCVDQ